MEKEHMIFAGAIVLVVLAWIVNLFKLIGVALAQDWDATVVHAIGLLGPVSVITVWF